MWDFHAIPLPIQQAFLCLKKKKTKQNTFYPVDYMTVEL